MREKGCEFRDLCGYTRQGDALQLTVGQEHLNGGEVVHGGVSATMLDPVSIHPTMLKEEQLMATVSLNIPYLNPARLGHILSATATIKKQGRDIAFIDAKIENQDGTIIAISSAIYKITTLEKPLH